MDFGIRSVADYTERACPMTPNASRLLLAPVVDIVLPTSEDDLDTVFDPRTRKLIGALHRRFWDRRRTLLQQRATGTLDIEPAYMQPEPAGAYGEIVADLRAHRSAWEDRVQSFIDLRTALTDRSEHSPAAIVRVRGWEETEAGVLVDGRAVPSCIVDVAIAMGVAAPHLRQGIQALVVDIDEAADSNEASLWGDLLQLAEDRTGVERGTVSLATLTEVESAHAAVA